MRFADWTGAGNPSTAVGGPAGAGTLIASRALSTRRIAFLGDLERFPLDFLFAKQQDLWVSDSLGRQINKHLLEEIDELPMFEWSPGLVPPFLHVVQRSHVFKLKIAFPYLEGFRQSHTSHDPF